MSADIRIGYVKRPTLGLMPLASLSLYECARSSSPIPATVESSQVSSQTSGTSLWRKSTARPVPPPVPRASRPSAR